VGAQSSTNLEHGVHQKVQIQEEEKRKTTQYESEMSKRRAEY
jgi:hypothetical protein